MATTKFTDNDVLHAYEANMNYEYEELDARPTYQFSYKPTPEELKDKPVSPLLNW